MQLKIGVIGHYGLGYLADDAMLYAIKEGFSRECSDATFFYPPDMERDDMDLLIIGGGTIVGDNHAYLHNIRRWIPNYDTPTIVLGVGFRDGRITEDKIEDTKSMFTSAKIHGVRGFLSQSKLKKWGIETQVIGDPVLLLNRYHKKKRDIRKVGIIARNIPEGQLQYGSNKESVHFFSQVIEYLQNEGYEVNFIPFTPTDLSHVAKELNTNITTPSNAEEAINLLHQMDFIVSERLHPFILSYMFGIPAIGIEVQFMKMHDFASTVPLTNHIIMRSALDMHIFTHKMATLLDNRDKVVMEAQIKMKAYTAIQYNIIREALSWM